MGPTEETAHLQSSQKGAQQDHWKLHILKFNPCNKYYRLCHPNSASFTEFRWPPRKKRHLFPWIPEASARSSARETHGDDSGGDLRERSSSVLSSSPSEEKISNNPNRDKKHIIPLNSSSLDFQLPRGIGQIQVETIWHIATTASCHLPALHILEKWILKFKVIPLAPHQNSRNHETKNCYWSSGLRSSWEGDHFHLQQNLRLKTPYSPKSEEYANIEKSQWEISTHNHFGSPDRKRWETPHLWLETYLSSNENPSTQTHFLGQISILPKETWQQDPTNRRKASNFWDVPSSHLTFRRIHPHSPVLRTPRCSCRWRASQYPTISLFADAAI